MSWDDDEQLPVEVELEVLDGRSEDAILVCEPGTVSDAWVWLPFSQIECIEDDDGLVDLVDLDVGMVCTFTIPHWLAEKEGWA